MKELDLVVVGDISWNHDITLSGERLSVGGAAYYSAVGAACFSNEIGVVGRVGEDFDLSYLRDKGINTRGIKVVQDEKTCRFEVTQHADGTRDFLAFRGAAKIVDTSIFPDNYRSARFIHLSTQQPDHALNWLDEFHRRGNISVDSFELFVKQSPELTREMFRRSNLIFANEDEWNIIKQSGEDFSDKPVIIKRGKNGACYKCGNEVISVSAPKVNAVDFSGPGDVLAGAFLALRAHDEPIDISLRKAVNLASLSVIDFGVEHLSRPNGSILKIED